MTASVHKLTQATVGYVRSDDSAEVYCFTLDKYNLRWIYQGKRVGHDAYIPTSVQGYEHIPQEFYAALDAAWHSDNGFVEFPDPLHDNLEAAGA